MQPVKKYVLTLLLPLFCLLSAVHIFLFHEFGHAGSSLSIAGGFVVTFTQTLAVWALLIIVNAYPTRVGILTYALIIASVLSVAVTFTDNALLKLLDSDHSQFSVFVKTNLPVHLASTWLITCWVATIVAMQKQLYEVKKMFVQQTDATSLLKEAELYKLRQQLQPHFLYNSLNSISALTMIEPAKAQEMIGKLSDFLRSSVKREASDHIPVTEELSYIESYLSIEAIRFGDRLKVVFEKEYTDDATVPPFLLQPVLENAIKFGLYGKTGQVTITVHIELRASLLYITISNPYDPQMQMPKGTGFGLEGIRRRLYLLFARADLLETSQENEIFTTVLKIPQHVQGDTDR
jgi:sensor histidine kinase YesM